MVDPPSHLALQLHTVLSVLSLTVMFRIGRPIVEITVVPHSLGFYCSQGGMVCAYRIRGGVMGKLCQQFVALLQYTRYP